ncbi:MAG TPA: hypothetical protein VN372_08520 [Methanospirillum sp.]|nr:hypothetical protein [Methanospirillum sp.]
MIDDLPKVLLHPDLGSDIIRILYNPDISIPSNSDYYTAISWDQISVINMGLYE